MSAALSNRMSRVVRLVGAIVCVCGFSLHSSAQDKPPVAPPPLSFVPTEVRTQLNSAKDAKARLKLTIELAEARLTNAENYSAGQVYEQAARELGIYQGLISDSMEILRALDSKKAKVRDLLKRLELALRAHAPRLESIRRTTPAEHAANVKLVADFARQSRADALNSFFGDTVMREDADKKKQNDNSKPPLD